MEKPANPYRELSRFDLELSLGITENHLDDAGEILEELQDSGLIPRSSELEGGEALAMLRLEVALRRAWA